MFCTLSVYNSAKGKAGEFFALRVGNPPLSSRGSFTGDLAPEKIRLPKLYLFVSWVPGVT